MWDTRPSFRTNSELIDFLADEMDLPETVVAAMKAVDRAAFLGADVMAPESPYKDSPLGIGHGQTISAPHMHAMALQLLSSRLRPDCAALDVGSGSGIMCAYLAEMIGLSRKDENRKAEEKGMVCGIETVQALYATGIQNIRKHNRGLLENARFILQQGDGWNGVSAHAPYDAIHVGAAAIGLPLALLDQMSVGGLMMLPYELSDMDQFLLIVKRVTEETEGKISAEGLDEIEREVRRGIGRSQPFKVIHAHCDMRE